MKKIVSLSLLLTIISSAVMAQRSLTGVQVRTQRFNSVRITRPERFQLRRDAIRLKLIQRNARRDDVITPVEKRSIHKAKNKSRRNFIRFRHNGRI